MWKKLLVAGLFGAAVTAIPLVVFAGDPSSSLDRQTSVTRAEPISTSSKAWHQVPGLRAFICAQHQVTATISANVAGAPVKFRVVKDVGPRLFPVSTMFQPASGTRGFSFSFVGPALRSEGKDGHEYDVDWASPTGKPVTLHGAVLNLSYQQGMSC